MNTWLPGSQCRCAHSDATWCHGWHVPWNSVLNWIVMTSPWSSVKKEVAELLNCLHQTSRHFSHLYNYRNHKYECRKFIVKNAKWISQISTYSWHDSCEVWWSVMHLIGRDVAQFQNSLNPRSVQIAWLLKINEHQVILRTSTNQFIILRQ